MPVTEPATAAELLARAERVRMLARWVNDEPAAELLRGFAAELEARAVRLQAKPAAPCDPAICERPD